MEDQPRPLNCFIAAMAHTSLDAQLGALGFAGGLIVFAIPDYGIIFRCRASGCQIDLEFGAFFAALKFIKTRLKDNQPKAVRVHSSNPEFVFSFTGKGKHLGDREDRLSLLKKYNEMFSLSVGYTKAADNRALVTADDFPSLPLDRRITLADDPFSLTRPQMKPFQRGIHI